MAIFWVLTLGCKIHFLFCLPLPLDSHWSCHFLSHLLPLPLCVVVLLKATADDSYWTIKRRQESKNSKMKPLEGK